MKGQIFNICVLLLAGVFFKSASALKCKQCSSADNPFCATDPTKIEATACPESQAPQLCYEQIEGQNTIRKCGAYDPTCSDPNTCLLCMKDDCNVDIIPENRLSCIKCAGTECFKITDQQSAVCDLYNKDDECVTIFTSDKEATRGCKSSLADICTNTNTCTSCKVSGCNNNDYVDPSKFSCYTCDSSDVNCNTWVEFSKLATPLCDTGINQCISTIGEDNKIVRRCAKKDEVCTDPKTCQLCSSPNCNAGVFPAERRLCAQCTGKDVNDDCNSGKGTSTACLIYSENTQCFAYADGNKNMVRGCADDSNDNFKNCKDATCQKCNTNNCNNTPYNRPAEIKCVKCGSADKSCEDTEVSIEKAVLCTKTVPFNTVEQCFIETITQEDNKVSTIRGCLYDLDEAGQTQCNGNANCKTCKTNGCNVAITDTVDYDNFSCYVCRSDIDSEQTCADQAQNLKPQKCNFPVTEKNAGCYVQRKANFVTRDCTSSFPYGGEGSFDACVESSAANEHTTCIKCTGPNCNNMKAPGSATGLQVYSSLLIISSFAILKFFK